MIRYRTQTSRSTWMGPTRSRGWTSTGTSSPRLRYPHYYYIPQKVVTDTIRATYSKLDPLKRMHTFEVPPILLSSYSATTSCSTPISNSTSLRPTPTPA